MSPDLRRAVTPSVAAETPSEPAEQPSPVAERTPAPSPAAAPAQAPPTTAPAPKATAASSAPASVPAAPVPMTTATLHGTVTRGGQPVPGARITLVADDGSERDVTAGPDGAYRFTQVPPGHYEVVAYAESGITCDAGGCISASWAQREEVTLSPGETRLDIDGD